MSKRIFRSTFAVALTALLACFGLTMGALYSYFQTVQRDQLVTELTLAADGVEQSGRAYLAGLDTDRCRLTWVAADGTVLFDTREDETSMENHAQREEIAAALATGTGESARYSATLLEKTLYRAKRLSDGTVLRVSVRHDTVLSLMLGMVWPLLGILALLVLFSAVLARRLAKKIVEPMNALDLDQPLENDAYDELSPLLTHIEAQHRQIRRQKAELAHRETEFFAVIENMREGLVLLDREDVILSINPAAAAFFGTDPGCVGRDFLSIERDREIGAALRSATETGHSALRVSRNGREYRLNLSRIQDGKGASGAVLLIFDVTDQVTAERSRREFTANVSHELKTPLHAILGSAELLENGLVKGEDVPGFVGRIRSEAQRLLALVEDTIRLSQLDEGAVPPREDVDLYKLVQAEVEALRPVAEGRDIALAVTGGPAVVQGVPQLFHEILYNLLENAVKYNREGGSVTATVNWSPEGAVLSVADTGIGIPLEHQSRVFERFYRVDKSRSKETGGTGLGLSIVKHAVQDMGGTLSLESVPGEGTTVTVRFPVES